MPCTVHCRRYDEADSWLIQGLAVQLRISARAAIVLALRQTENVC